MRHLIGHLSFDLGKGTNARINSCVATSLVDVSSS